MASKRLMGTQGEQKKLIQPTDPYRLPMGHAKLALATLGSLYIGGKIAQFGVYLLDEYEIFVHSDDDDD
ncbi:unnamed protein product [Bursaphelenchus xylophilus]|uniref:Essential MCU regulator, mitochondrial n=1 Tax=Bursaphelenchus xylophilus TaxID=6326 RepID=A0A1I7SGJ1_BURXY|nr:unnamed protein product [Bursaphelenchus xylophilus]CAG9111320.1 unnamed protein product [Bursaphelenchus xylophilus]